ncbi:hypothetical protein EXIGLDRAFT_840196 [Exidia glandulosa HHB12029]|uniref:Uncharacterized protein n=1 Tax=Exidia glandulosa HHB12029 TaxID=1314781 RepID=A0A165EKD8_EXIGL|nr:hypothetical protein EXIGLDRAFT_840196 [Exidia glandulosa HHB12029]
MGFFPRLFSSLRGRKDKSKSKPAPQAPPPQPARRTISENELLRMSSRNASVYSQIDFLDPNAPPMPHPINDVTRANSRASSYLDRQPSYKVHVHEPQPRSRVPSSRSDMAPPPPPPPTRKPVPSLDVGPVTPPRQTAQPPPILSPEDARQLQRLRSDANLSNLMALYATHGAQPRDLDEQFRNTPARDRDRERKQRNRASTDLRSLLHASPAKDSDDDDEDESGDVLAWADKLIDATMLDANPDPDASFLPLPEPEQDEELYFSSLIAEVGSADAHSPSVRLDSDMAPVQVAPDDAREKAQLTRSGSVRASLVFDFLLRKEDQRDDDHDRSLRRSASTGSTVLFSSTTRTAPVPPAKDRDERALFRHSTTSVTMLQSSANPTVARHNTAVPYPAVSTRPLRTSTNGTGRPRTSSIPLLVPAHSRASSLRQNPDHDERGGRPASSLGLYDPDRVPERQTSVKQLASKFNAGASTAAPPKRIGGPRAMRAPSPVKRQRNPLRASNRDEAENPFVVQKKGPGRTLSLKELGYDEVHEGVVADKDGEDEKENMRVRGDVNYPYTQEHTPTKPLPLLHHHLDAPSPAPSRASSSEMSPIGKMFQYDARLKAAGSRVWR